MTARPHDWLVTATGARCTRPGCGLKLRIAPRAVLADVRAALDRVPCQGRDEPNAAPPEKP